MKTDKRFAIITMTVIMLLVVRYDAFTQNSERYATPSEWSEDGKPLTMAEQNLQNFNPDSPDEKLNVLREKKLRLIVKIEHAIAENTTDAAGIAELKSRLASIESQIATREVQEKETLDQERRYISRLTGFNYQNGISISETLKNYTPVRNKELNALNIELLTKQAQVETNFKTLSEDEQAASSVEIKNLQIRINKVNDKINAQQNTGK